jgi:hypothetical protein
MVTIKDIEKQLEHSGRLELAGISNGNQDIGPYAILWVKYDQDESWEILPLWLADMVVSDLHNHDKVRKAIVYKRLPENAPLGIVKEWLKLHFPDGLFTSASVVEAA